MQAPVQRKKVFSKNSNQSFRPKDYEDRKKTKSSSDSICLYILKGILTLIILNFAASYFITETWLWGYEGKYSNWRNWIPVCN
jgi:hypothetical protein